MIWATLSSWSCFGWLYRASSSLDAKNIINVICVLTIWWCPCVLLPLHISLALKSEIMFNILSTNAFSLSLNLYLFLFICYCQDFIKNLQSSGFFHHSKDKSEIQNIWSPRHKGVDYHSPQPSEQLMSCHEGEDLLLYF